MSNWKNFGNACVRVYFVVEFIQESSVKLICQHWEVIKSADEAKLSLDFLITNQIFSLIIYYRKRGWFLLSRKE